METFGLRQCNAMLLGILHGVVPPHKGTTVEAMAGLPSKSANSEDGKFRGHERLLLIEAPLTPREYRGEASRETQAGQKWVPIGEDPVGLYHRPRDARKQPNFDSNDVRVNSIVNSQREESNIDENSIATRKRALAFYRLVLFPSQAVAHGLAIQRPLDTDCLQCSGTRESGRARFQLHRKISIGENTLSRWSALLLHWCQLTTGHG